MLFERGRDFTFSTIKAYIAMEVYLDRGTTEEEYRPIIELADILEENSRISGDDSRGNLDVCEELMMAELISSDKEYWRGKNFREIVYLQTNLLAKEIRNFKEFSREKQKELRSLCVDLSNKAGNLHWEYHGPRRYLAA